MALQNDTDIVNSMSEFPFEIDVSIVKQLLESPEDFLLLDCREQNEREFVYIEGSMHIPMNETPARMAELEAFAQKRIVVHCHHGGRSQQVTRWLRSQGFEKAQNMTGGIDAWSVTIDPNLSRY
jgi:rhodanese-related sulfurtransferase